jgi:hypothetical protein
MDGIVTVVCAPAKLASMVDANRARIVLFTIFIFFFSFIFFYCRKTIVVILLQIVFSMQPNNVSVWLFAEQLLNCSTRPAFQFNKLVKGLSSQASLFSGVILTMALQN